MILYYSPKACSQAPHIILHETGIAHDSIAVDLKTKRTADDRDYLTVNRKGAVPALDLGNGEILTENAVVLQYIAESAGDTALLPPVGDFRRYRVLEWLNFVATELHKGFAPLFKASDEATRQFARDQVTAKLDFVEGELSGRPYLMGEQMTLPDAYLFVILGWIGTIPAELGRWPNLKAFCERMEQRPAVRRVLEFEGLVEKESA